MTENIGSVSVLSMSFMGIFLILSIVLPVLLIIRMGVKKRLNWRALRLG